MDSIYSLSLLLSVVAGGLGAALFILVAAQPSQPRMSGPKVVLAAFVFGATALSLGIISVLVHLIFGHGSESDAPMTTVEFFGHHKAYWLVLVLTVLAFKSWQLAGRYQDNNHRSN